MLNKSQSDSFRKEGDTITIFLLVHSLFAMYGGSGFNIHHLIAHFPLHTSLPAAGTLDRRYPQIFDDSVQFGWSSKCAGDSCPSSLCSVTHSHISSLKYLFGAYFPHSAVLIIVHRLRKKMSEVYGTIPSLSVQGRTRRFPQHDFHNPFCRLVNLPGTSPSCLYLPILFLLLEKPTILLLFRALNPNPTFLLKLSRSLVSSALPNVFFSWLGSYGKGTLSRIALATISGKMSGDTGARSQYMASGAPGGNRHFLLCLSYFSNCSDLFSFSSAQSILLRSTLKEFFISPKILFTSRISI